MAEFETVHQHAASNDFFHRIWAMPDQVGCGADMEPAGGCRTSRCMGFTDLGALREQCLILIEAHFTRPEVSPVWLAQELYVSRRQLDRAFAGGPGVAEALGRRRLKQVVIVAARNPTMAMSAIAVHCGYGTYETFRSQCHRYLHRTPRQARHDVTVALAA